MPQGDDMRDEDFTTEVYWIIFSHEISTQNVVEDVVEHSLKF